MWFLSLAPNGADPTDLSAVDVWEIDDEQADRLRVMFGKPLASVLASNAKAAEFVDTCVILGSD